MPGLNVTYTGSKDDVIGHLTDERDKVVEAASAPRLGQIAKAKLDGEVAGFDRAIRVLTQWTGPDGDSPA